MFDTDTPAIDCHLSEEGGVGKYRLVQIDIPDGPRVERCDYPADPDGPYDALGGVYVNLMLEEAKALHKQLSECIAEIEASPDAT
jgi:hypothetical protein